MSRSDVAAKASFTRRTGGTGNKGKGARLWRVDTGMESFGPSEFSNHHCSVGATERAAAHLLDGVLVLHRSARLEGGVGIRVGDGRRGVTLRGHGPPSLGPFNLKENEQGKPDRHYASPSPPLGHFPFHIYAACLTQNGHKKSTPMANSNSVPLGSPIQNRSVTRGKETSHWRGGVWDHHQAIIWLGYLS